MILIETLRQSIEDASDNSIRLAGFGLSVITCLTLFILRPENVTLVNGLAAVIFPAASVFTVVDYVRGGEMSIHMMRLKKGQDDGLRLFTVWFIPGVSVLILLAGC